MKNKLKKYDDKYFDDSYFESGIPKSEKQVSYALATHMFDRDMLDLSEDTWNTFEKIKKIFGVKMKDKVLYNLCTRNYDT